MSVRRAFTTSPTTGSLRGNLAALVILTVTVALAPASFAPANGATWADTVSGSRTAQTRTTAKTPRYASQLGTVQGKLNECRGPVAWNSRGEGARWLMFEHDHCGGAWALWTRTGDRLMIRNGTLAGTWRANGKVRVVTRGAMVSTTKHLGRLVVQTCIPGTSRMRLVGFSRVR